MATGLSNQEIATALVISEHTVRRHLQNIFAKIGVPSRAAATAYALFQHDLISPPAGRNGPRRVRGAWYARAMTALPVVRTVTSGRQSGTPHRGGLAMPQYLDHHPTIPDMPPEMVAFITQRLTSGQPDEFGGGCTSSLGHSGPGATPRHRARTRSAGRTRRSGIDLDPRDVAEVQVLP